MRHPATLKTMPIPANYYYYDRCDRSDHLNGGNEQLAMTVAHISVDGDNTMTDRPGFNEVGVQAPVSRSSSREMFILWVKHCT